MTRVDAKTLSAAASTADRTSRCQKLKCRQKGKPDPDEYRCRARIRRSMDEVQPELKAKLRGLVAGDLPWPFFLHGPVGCGKTRAILALTDLVTDARFWTLSELMDGVTGRRLAPWSGLWWRNGPQLAVVDEFGLSPGEAGKLDYDALLAFAEWREDRPAIYISNHDPETLEKLYDERIYSRLMCGTHHKLVDVDRRFQTPDWMLKQREEKK